MANNKQRGNDGEIEVVKMVACPNCKKDLMLLPPNYPLYDVQCTGCSFRAQIKTISSKPKKLFFGAGWDIMEKVLKSGFMIPPLFANFKWEEKGQPQQEIRFYPFVPKVNLRKYQLSPTARRANYKMFHYNDMDKLPFFTVYKTKE
jgi:DNA-directed RNA polymerase subunit RPC12/RpoP